MKTFVLLGNHKSGNYDVHRVECAIIARNKQEALSKAKAYIEQALQMEPYVMQGKWFDSVGETNEIAIGALGSRTYFRLGSVSVY